MRMLLNGDRHDEPHSMRFERDADVEMASAGVLQRVDDGFPRDPSCIHNRGRQRAR
jgi:hypothetical protein